jgi:uncharacterized protein (UPF0332 family)
MAPATEEQLLRVVEARIHEVRLWNEGIYLQTASTTTLAELLDRAVVDRLLLAERFLSAGGSLMRCRPPRYRDAISRYYYAMYHSVRAAALYHYRGDDHEEHSTLQKMVPSDLPDVENWKNALKNARLRRNAADYEPYPAIESAWRPQAIQIRTDAAELVRIVRVYLVSKGCRFA